MTMFSVEKMPPWMLSHSRSIMVGGLILSISFVGLVLSAQITMIEEAHSRSRSSYSLSHDILQLRSEWSHTRAGIVKEHVEQAERMLLRDFNHLTIWLKDLEQRVSTMDLLLHYRVRPVHIPTVDLHDVEVIPVDLEILPEPSSGGSGAYQSYVRVLRALATDQIRVDLQEVQVQGGAGAAHMNVLIHVWVKVAA